jgi:hypothetical protein
MRILFQILFGVLFVSAIAGLVLQYIFLLKLRTRHTPTWIALGRPTLFFNNSIANSFAVIGFLWRREYRTIPDQQFLKLSGVLRMFLITYLVLFVFVTLLFFLIQGKADF